MHFLSGQLVWLIESGLSKNSDEASTCLWTRRNTAHLCCRDPNVFYHINITQWKLTLGIKKKTHLYNLYICFFLAVLLHYTSLNRNSQVKQQINYQRKEVTLLLMKQDLSLFWQINVCPNLLQVDTRYTNLYCRLDKKFVPDHFCRFH